MSSRATTMFAGLILDFHLLAGPKRSIKPAKIGPGERTEP
jgi:hypothetical protein